MKAINFLIPVFLLCSCGQQKQPDTTTQTATVPDTAKMPSTTTSTMTSTGEITTAAYANVVRSNKIVLVDFSAIWCGPCQHLAPKIEELKREMPGKFILAKVDVDRDRALADSMHIESMPTLIIYNSGVQKWKQVGDLEKEDLRKAILDAQ